MRASLQLSPQRTIFGFGAALVFSAATFAYTASNDVSPSRAGDGAAAISGYVVSDVKYVLDAAKPSEVDAVVFKLDAPAASVRAKLVSSATAYTACTSDGDMIWTCDVAPNPAVAMADQLSVVAHQ